MTSVLHIISGLGVGGAEGMLFQIASGLTARGHRQHVVSLTGRGPIAVRLEAAGVDTSYFDLRRFPGMASGAFKLMRLVHEVKPDVIQGWMYHGDLGATFAQAVAKKAFRPKLAWGVRCSDMDLARNARIIALSARLSSRPDVVVANSHAGAEVHRVRGYRPRRLEIIPNGIDTARFRPDPQQRAEVRAELGLDPSARVAIHVARVDPMKDHTSFLEAVRRAPDVCALLVGEGTEALDLPSNMRALGRRSDIPRLLAAADMIVSSSAFGEGFSNALAEGMSTGLAPIGTDAGDTALIVGGTGTVVPSRDPAALAEAMQALAMLDGYTLATRGAAARARIVEHYDLVQAIDRFEALYRSLTV
jgi:glycosyltransferase involved in cell wall biosynthesis